MDPRSQTAGLFAVIDGRPLSEFPPTDLALTEPNGLLAVGGDLSVDRLIAAYRRGIFPWYSAGQPLLWWSPDPRAVLFPGQVHISRSMARTLRQRRFEITCDQAFEAVIAGCAEPRNDDDGTWITKAMAHAYTLLHQQGIAHSIECWREGQLCGGLYGVALGRMFFAESMFSRHRDASKAALISLAGHLQAWNFALIDCQVSNPHLVSLGATTVSRANFEATVALAVDQSPDPAAWQARDITP